MVIKELSLDDRIEPLKITLEIPEISTRSYNKMEPGPEYPTSMIEAVESEYFSFDGFLEDLSESKSWYDTILYSEPRNGSKEVSEVNMFLYKLRGVAHLVRSPDGDLDPEWSFEFPTFSAEPRWERRDVADICDDPSHKDCTDVFVNYVEQISSESYSSHVVMDAWLKLEPHTSLSRAREYAETQHLQK